MKILIKTKFLKWDTPNKDKVLKDLLKDTLLDLIEILILLLKINKKTKKY